MIVRTVLDVCNIIYSPVLLSSTPGQYGGSALEETIPMLPTTRDGEPSSLTSNPHKLTSQSATHQRKTSNPNQVKIVELLQLANPAAEIAIKDLSVETKGSNATAGQ